MLVPVGLEATGTYIRRVSRGQDVGLIESPRGEDSLRQSFVVTRFQCMPALLISLSTEQGRRIQIGVEGFRFDGPSSIVDRSIELSGEHLGIGTRWTFPLDEIPQSARPLGVQGSTHAREWNLRWSGARRKTPQEIARRYTGDPRLLRSVGLLPHSLEQGHEILLGAAT